MCVVASEGLLRLQTETFRTRKGCRASNGAGHFGRAIDAVRVAGKVVNTRLAIQFPRGGEHDLGVWPAYAFAAPCHRAFCSRQKQHGRARGIDLRLKRARRACAAPRSRASVTGDSPAMAQRNQVR